MNNPVDIVLHNLNFNSFPTNPDPLLSIHQTIATKKFEVSLTFFQNRPIAFFDTPNFPNFVQN